VKCTSNGCGFNDTYVDGSSVSGYVTETVISVGDFVGVPIMMGAITTSTPNFELV
jgi:hypothetical protein